MNRNRLLLALLLALAAPVAAACAEPPPMPAAATPDDVITAVQKGGAGARAEVIFENDRVRVIELEVDPGASTGMHAHGEHLVYFLTPVEGQHVEADGTSHAIHLDRGDVRWGEAGVHDTANGGTGQTRTLIVEFK